METVSAVKSELRAHSAAEQCADSSQRICCRQPVHYRRPFQLRWRRIRVVRVVEVGMRRHAADSCVATYHAMIAS